MKQWESRLERLLERWGLLACDWIGSGSRWRQGAGILLALTAYLLVGCLLVIWMLLPARWRQ